MVLILACSSTSPRTDAEGKSDAKDEDGNDNMARAKSQKDDDDDDDDKMVPIYIEARRLFNNHEVLLESEIDLKW